MAQAYSDPKRENDPYALPDLEIWQAIVFRLECRKCGDFEIDEDSALMPPDGAICPSCERTEHVEQVVQSGRKGWFYWFCFPGCLPDSEAMGPFETKMEALADARQGIDEE